MAAVLTAALAVASTGNAVSDLDNLEQADILPQQTTQPDSGQDEAVEGENPEEAAEEATDGGAEDEAWKSNLGSIVLGDTITFEGEGISVEGSTVHITAGGDYSLSGTLADGMIHINTKEKVKLRLDGVDITNSNGPAVYFEDAKKAFITISKDTVNSLSDGGSYAVDAKATLFSNDTLEIKGGGTLNITGNVQHAIASDDDIIIENGNINILGAVKDGIHANDNVTITGGVIDIKATSDAIESEADVVIGGGSMKIDAGDDGIHAATTLGIMAGDIDITNSYEGIEGKTVITIDGGTIRIKASDDPVNAGEDIVINGGYLYAEGNGDGIDSNGNMTINGGTVIAFGGANGEGPIDVGEGNSALCINGGTVIAGGGNMRVNVSESSQQRSVWLGGQFNAGTLVNIAGNGVSETFTMMKQGSLIFYSSDKLQADGEYTVSTGGSSTGEAVDGVYTGGEYSGGTQLGSFTASAMNSVVGNAGGMGGMGGGRPGGGMDGQRPEGGNMGEMPEGFTPPTGERPQRTAQQQ